MAQKAQSKFGCCKLYCSSECSKTKRCSNSCCALLTMTKYWCMSHRGKPNISPWTMSSGHIPLTSSLQNNSTHGRPSFTPFLYRHRTFRPLLLVYSHCELPTWNKKAELSQRWPRDASYVYGCPENFRESLTTPTATFLESFNRLLFRLSP